MQPANLKTTSIVLRLLLRTGLFIAVCLFNISAFAQSSKDSTIVDSTQINNTREAIDTSIQIISTFETFNMPPEMLAHFGQVKPEEALTLHEEFQVTQKDEDGQAILITVKLRFENDYLTGYIVEAPIDKSIDLTVSNFVVRIPIEWICTPATPDHPEHYVGSLAAIKTAESQYKCTGWHIKLPQAEHPQMQKKKRKKDKKAAPAEAKKIG